MQINTEKYSKLTNTEYVTFKGLQLTQPQKQNPDNGKNMSWSDNCQSRILYYGRLQFKNKGVLFFFLLAMKKIHLKSNLRKALILVHDLRRFISSLQGGKNSKNVRKWGTSSGVKEKENVGAQGIFPFSIAFSFGPQFTGGVFSLQAILSEKYPHRHTQQQVVRSSANWQWMLTVTKVGWREHRQAKTLTLSITSISGEEISCESF